MILRPVAPPVEYGITKRLARAGNAAIAFLRSLGTNAHVWLPGANGVSVASLPSNNYLLSDGSTGYSTVDGVDGLVKDAMDPVTGINLTQATTANKPLVRRGMLNLLTYSNDLTNAAWTKATATVNTSAVLSPDGSTSFTITDNATASDHKVRQVAAVATGTAVTCAVIAKAGTAGYLWAYDGYANVGRSFQLSDGGILGILGGTPTSSTYADLGNGWGLYTMAYTTSTPTRPDIGLSQDGVNLNYSGSGKTIIVGSAGLFHGTWTAAQILAEGGIPTTTATAASNPSAGKYWWSFDGSNDSLLSGNLGITNACTIVVAGLVNSLAATQMLFAETTNGVQVSIATDGSVSLTKVGGAALVATAAGVVVAGVPFVLTARLSAGTADIRKNGAQSATAASATVFAAVTGARIGTAFDGTTSPTGGALGWVVPLPAALSDADCLTVERLVGSQFPGMATF
jgi:hypothetical protein